MSSARAHAYAYAEDLAFVHDAGFGVLAKHAASALLANLGKARATIVELGCGSGISSRVLSRAGHDVLGIDPSPAFLALARRNAPRARFKRGSFARSSLPRCDAITAIGEVLSYATEAGSGWRAVVRFFRRAHAALRPGGVLLFDVACPGRVPGGHKQGFAAHPGWIVIFESHEDRKARTLTRRIISLRKTGRAFRRSDETHKLWLYPPADVTRALRAAGFRVTRPRGYAGLTFPPGWRAFLARR